MYIKILPVEVDEEDLVSDQHKLLCTIFELSYYFFLAHESYVLVFWAYFATLQMKMNCIISWFPHVIVA